MNLLQLLHPVLHQVPDLSAILLQEHKMSVPIDAQIRQIYPVHSHPCLLEESYRAPVVRSMETGLGGNNLHRDFCDIDQLPRRLSLEGAESEILSTSFRIRGRNNLGSEIGRMRKRRRVGQRQRCQAIRPVSNRGKNLFVERRACKLTISIHTRNEVPPLSSTSSSVSLLSIFLHPHYPPSLLHFTEHLLTARLDRHNPSHQTRNLIRQPPPKCASLTVHNKHTLPDPCH